MRSNITTLHIQDLKLVSALSIAVYVLCDRSGMSQFSLSVRFISNSGPKKNNFMDLLPLKVVKGGEDITKAVFGFMLKHFILVIKLFQFQQRVPEVLPAK
ncbi:hypothetical protein DMUE_1711 [Dictyocoela muelleri]|nr:hypothetical protein DMUE_1711 [Dictyocoela muelleri]